MGVLQPAHKAPRRRSRTRLTVSALVIVLVVGSAAGWLWGRSGIGEVHGDVLWSSPEFATQLGPAGWFRYPDDGAVAIRNAHTAETWHVDDLASDGEILPDGRAVQAVGSDIHVHDREHTVSTTTLRILEASGDLTRWPGTDADLVGASDQHVAVLTCLSPRRAALHDDVEGGSQVLAGIRLADASVTWTYDTGARCGSHQVHAGYPSTLPAQTHVLLEPTDGTAVALDLDTGQVARTWPDTPAREITLQRDLVLAPDGEDAVALSSLRSGAVLARVQCRGARAGDPLDVSRQLSPTVPPYVTCLDTVHVLHEGRFTEIEAAPLGADGLPDGEEVARGHLLLRRDGGSVRLRDGRSGAEIGVVDVPRGFEPARYGPLGRLVVFVDMTTSGRRPVARYIVVDADTARVVATTSGRLRTGAPTTAEGEIMFKADEIDDDDVIQTWVAAAEGTVQ